MKSPPDTLGNTTRALTHVCVKARISERPDSGGGGNMFGPNPTTSTQTCEDAGSSDDADPPYGISEVMLEFIFAKSFEDLVALNIQNYTFESVDDLIIHLFSISLSTEGYDFILSPLAIRVTFSPQMITESFFVCPDYESFVEQPGKTVLNPGYGSPIMVPGSNNGIGGYYYFVVQYKWRMIQ